MKTITLLLLTFFSISNTAFAQNHKVRCTETEGCKLLEEEGTIRNGKKEGRWKNYYGHITGHRLHEEGDYENDKKVGMWKTYSPHKYLNRTTPFSNGLENGEETSYYESGEISGKSTYLNGKVIGEAKGFYENGKIKSLYNPSTGESKSYHLNGKLESIGFFNPSEYYEKVGEWKEYYENGNLKNVGSYKGTAQVGIWKEYFDNGTLKAVGEMKGSIRIGKWKTYHNNGQLSGSGEYKKDGYPLENSWITYDRSGQLDHLNFPEPTKDQILGLFLDISQNEQYEGPYKFSFTFQETLWKMAGANPKEYLSSYPVQKWEVLKEIEGYQKVIRLWNKYNVNFVAGGFVTNIASGKNILKFAIDAGSTVILLEAVKKYHFDLNFIDPADGKTVLDFLQDRIQYVKNSLPVDEAKVREYERYYNMLKTYGVQHAVELK